MNSKYSSRKFLQYALLLWFLLTTVSPLPSYAQDMPLPPFVPSKLEFNQISREDGLPSNSISCIFQDSRGFLWFGTQSGLVRYDNYELKVYKKDPVNPLSLSDNIIKTIYEDRSGKLWIGTAIGLNRFDHRTESFKSYLPVPGDSSSLSDSYIMSIYEDQQGLFWVGTQSGGLNLMDREKETFIHYLPDPSLQGGFVSNAISSITESVGDPEILWVGTSIAGSGHAQFNTTNRKFQFNSKHLSGHQRGYHWVTAQVYRSLADEVWLATYNGLDLYDEKKAGFITYNHIPTDSLSLSQGRLTSIAGDRDGRLWVGSWSNGLHLFDRKSNVFHRYQTNPKNPRSLSSNRISSLYQDRSGVLWVGTFGEGVNFTDKNQKKFQQGLAQDYGFLKDRSVSSVFEDRQGGLWIGLSTEGLYYLAPDSKTPQHFKQDPGDPQSLSSNAILWVTQDQTGKIWIGANNAGLNRLDPRNGEVKVFRHDPAQPTSLGNNLATGFLHSQDGTMWVGHAEGLQIFDPDTEKFASFPLLDGEEEQLFIAGLYEDRSGIIWIATQREVMALNPKTGKVRRFHAENQSPNTLRGYPGRVILEDSYGNIWAGYRDGLNKIVFTGGGNFEDKKANIRLYTEKNGLASNHITGLLEDDKGRLWISTWNGLSLFKNPQHQADVLPDFKNYDVQDGLQDYRFNEQACFKNSKGEIFLGSSAGLDVFHPDSIQENSYVPPVVITSFEKFNMDFPDHSASPIPGISEKEEVKISYKNNIFSIGFAALNFREGHKNEYAYQLEGFSNGWIQLGTEHQVTFTSLDPGTYTFRVKGSNNDGIWNEVPTELKIVITPPWWATWWAYTIYALAALFAIYSLRKYEMNRQQLKHDLQLRQMEGEKLQELDQLKSRFFANISHEFRTPLTLILGPLEQLIAGKLNGDPAYQYRLMQRSGQRLLRLINQLLDLSKLEAGKMKLRAQYGDLIPWIKGTLYSFESLAESKGVSLHFTTELDSAMLYVDQEKLEHVFSNLLSNAFKFTTKEDSVSISLKPVQHAQSDGFLQIEIADTGSGIPEDQLSHIFDRFYQGSESFAKDEQGSGIGLALTKELVELHSGQIRVESELGQGTRFIILLPFGKAHLQREELVRQKADTVFPTVEPSLLTSKDIPSNTVQAARELVPALSSKARKEAENIILLVEDNTDMRTFIRAQLADHYQVIEAADGQEGIEKAIEYIPNLIISDVMMPRADGLQLCNTLKNDERTSHIPIILLTAKADIESRLAGLNRGADAYLAKPFNRQELLVHSRNLLELRRRLRARYASLEVVEPVEDKGLQMEDAFLQKIRQIVEQDLSSLELDMETLCKTLGMSRSQVFRKTKALTGLSPSLFIRSIRLHRARDLLQTTDLTVSEVAYETGFSTPGYFSNVFLETFGIRPSELRK